MQHQLIKLQDSRALDLKFHTLVAHSFILVDSTKLIFEWVFIPNLLNQVIFYEAPLEHTSGLGFQGYKFAVVWMRHIDHLLFCISCLRVLDKLNFPRRPLSFVA